MTEIQYCEKYWISRNIAIASIPVFHYDNKVSRKYLFVYDATLMDGVSNKGVSNKGVNIMGREVRRVPANWDHWSYSDQPLFDNFKAKLARWDEHNANWEEGLYFDYINKTWTPIPSQYKVYEYSQWDNPRPDPIDYMPDWDESERTHYQAYENTTEGTPISPVMATEDDLIDWLVDNKASAFGDMTGDRDFWTSVVKQNSGGLITITKLK